MTYTQEEIFRILNNPEEFKKFMEFFNDNSHFMGEYPEDGYFYRPIADNIFEAINLYLNPDKAKEKHNQFQEEFDEQNELPYLEREDLIVAMLQLTIEVLQ